LQRSYFAPQDTDSIEVTTAAHEIGAAAAAIKKRPKGLPKITESR